MIQLENNLSHQKCFNKNGVRLILPSRAPLGVFTYCSVNLQCGEKGGHLVKLVQEEIRYLFGVSM